MQINNKKKYHINNFARLHLKPVSSTKIQSIKLLHDPVLIFSYSKRYKKQLTHSQQSRVWVLILKKGFCVLTFMVLYFFKEAATI